MASLTTSPEPRPLAGILTLVFGLFAFTVQDLVIKSFSDTYSVVQIVLLRAAVAVPIMATMVYLTAGIRGFVPHRPALLIAKGLLGYLSYLTYYMAVAELPLAQVVGIVFTAPVIVTSLSAVVLKEHVGVRRWSAVVIGFMATLVIVNPSGDYLNVAALLALFAAITYAGLTLLTVYVSPANTGWTISMYSMLTFFLASVVTSVFTTLHGPDESIHASFAFLFREWVWPPLSDLSLMLALGVIASIGFFCLVKAYSIAPMSVVAPFEYTYIIWAILFGYLIWGEVPTASTLVGAGVLILASLYVLYRERQVAGLV